MDRTEVQILRKLKVSPLDLWQIINLQDGDIKETLSVLRNLNNKGMVVFEGDKVRLSDSGALELSRLGIIEYQKVKCDCCKGKGLVVEGFFRHKMEVFEKVFLNRPVETAEFDQGVVPPENSFRRVEFLYERGDLERRKILLLGDDDLTSVALSLTGMPESVHVIEIDSRIVDYINVAAKELNLRLSAEEYNATKPLPAHLRSAFDVFLTDPVETVKGTLLFLSRCAQSLRGKGSSGYFGLSHYESSLKKWFQIQMGLLEMGFVITDVLRDFNEYLLTGERILEEGFLVVKESPVEVKAPQYPWYRSTFFRLELVKELVPFAEGEVEWDRTLYFDEDTFVVKP